MRRGPVAGVLIAFGMAAVSGAGGACGAFTDGTVPDAGPSVEAGTESGADRAATVDASAPDAIVDLIPTAGRLVFVTDGTRTPPFTIKEIDVMCAQEALAAGRPGIFVAWLSAASAPALMRLDKTLSWYLRDGSFVADYHALTLGALVNPIERNAAGAVVVGEDVVWTGTLHDGAVANDRCDDWSTTKAMGRFGDYMATGGSWTSNDIMDCAIPARFYCFEL